MKDGPRLPGRTSNLESGSLDRTGQHLIRQEGPHR